MELLSIGADPELFVSNAKGKKAPASAIGAIGGSKWEPQMFKGYGLQEDNVLAEFSMPPITCRYNPAPGETFSAYIANGIKHLNERLLPRDLKTIKGTSHDYSPEQLSSYGPAALEFGCDPDFNAYTGEQNPAPNKQSTLRTAGGHVHFGIPGKFVADERNIRSVVQAMDLMLGVPSVLLDEDTRRRELYGKAGAYRAKAYGGEYRTLSNFWIHSDELRKWVFAATNKAAKCAQYIQLLHLTVGPDVIQDCINTSNKELAQEIINTFGIYVPKQTSKKKGARNAQAA